MKKFFKKCFTYIFEFILLIFYIILSILVVLYKFIKYPFDLLESILIIPFVTEYEVENDSELGEQVSESESNKESIESEERTESVNKSDS